MGKLSQPPFHHKLVTQFGYWFHSNIFSAEWYPDHSFLNLLIYEYTITY